MTKTSTEHPENNYSTIFRGGSLELETPSSFTKLPPPLLPLSLETISTPDYQTTLVFESTSPITFSFWFTLYHRKYTFAGSFNYAVPHFACSASLHYCSLSQLTGCRPFTGTLGRFVIELKLSNGVVIKGRLIPPIMRALFVSGCGKWEVKELQS
ncbi:hypothetical protein BJ165DRAFT_1447375 [Panaeolus papilionaceus]|nr:hypothetical protein BJ165DRAFT_1447375 [Panaeolus papilionaceus]